MKKATFDELLKSVSEAGEIARGDRKASRVFEVSALRRALLDGENSGDAGELNMNDIKHKARLGLL